MSKMTELATRLRKLETEAALITRRREEETAKAMQILSSISAEDIEMIRPVVPEIVLLSSITRESLNDPESHDRENLVTVLDKLGAYLEERLSFYEGKL